MFSSTSSSLSAKSTLLGLHIRPCSRHHLAVPQWLSSAAWKESDDKQITCRYPSLNCKKRISCLVFSLCIALLQAGPDIQMINVLVVDLRLEIKYGTISRAVVALQV